MDVRKFGYIRVSSKDQNEGRQLEAMKAKGIGERDIFMDKQSGKDFNRTQYQLLKRMLRKGDVLYIHSLDRFGRNKEEILQEWNDITKNIQADIVVVDMPLLDTTQFKDSYRRNTSKKEKLPISRSLFNNVPYTNKQTNKQARGLGGSNLNNFIVMQGHTYQEEKDLGIIWSPQQDKGGNVPHSWKRMTEVKEGDRVFHYVKGNIVAISIASESCKAGSKPSILQSHNRWNDDGYLVNLECHELDKRVNVREIIRH